MISNDGGSGGGGGGEPSRLVCKQAIRKGGGATKACSQPLNGAGMLHLFPERRGRKLGRCWGKLIN